MVVYLFIYLNGSNLLVQDVLYTICNNCGPVQRIVIFRKNGVQAMVEYPFLSFMLLVDILIVICVNLQGPIVS